MSNTVTRFKFQSLLLVTSVLLADLGILSQIYPYTAWILYFAGNLLAFLTLKSAILGCFFKTELSRIYCISVNQ